MIIAKLRGVRMRHGRLRCARMSWESGMRMNALALEHRSWSDRAQLYVRSPEGNGASKAAGALSARQYHGRIAAGRGPRLAYHRSMLLLLFGERRKRWSLWWSGDAGHAASIRTLVWANKYDWTEIRTDAVKLSRRLWRSFRLCTRASSLRHAYEVALQHLAQNSSRCGVMGILIIMTTGDEEVRGGAVRGERCTLSEATTE